MSANIEQIKSMLERAGKTNLLQKQKVDLDKERLQLEATVNIEKVDKSLEEAANKFAIFYDQGTCNGIAQDCFKAGAEWQKEQMVEQARQALAKTDITLADLVAFDEGFKLGRRLERQNMVKEAVEGVARPDDCEIWVNLVGYGYKFKDGDKVRVIIIKEDEK